MLIMFSICKIFLGKCESLQNTIWCEKKHERSERTFFYWTNSTDQFLVEFLFSDMKAKCLFGVNLKASLYSKKYNFLKKNFDPAFFRRFQIECSFPFRTDTVHLSLSSMCPLHYQKKEIVSNESLWNIQLYFRASYFFETESPIKLVSLKLVHLLLDAWLNISLRLHLTAAKEFGNKIDSAKKSGALKWLHESEE